MKNIGRERGKAVRNLGRAPMHIHIGHTQKEKCTDMHFGQCPLFLLFLFFFKRRRRKERGNDEPPTPPTILEEKSKKDQDPGEPMQIHIHRARACMHARTHTRPKTSTAAKCMHAAFFVPTILEEKRKVRAHADTQLPTRVGGKEEGWACRNTWVREVVNGQSFCSPCPRANPPGR